MSWFQLDSESVVQRARESGRRVELPSMSASVVRGMVGFMVVSVAGFAPWAVWGRQLSRVVGEAGMYAVCALVFIGLAGVLLHRLVIGPGSLSRFYKLFGVTFAVYSVAWIGGWMALRGHPGSVCGLLAGTALMGFMLRSAFDASAHTLKIVSALFLLNAAGYFVGGWVEQAVAGPGVMVYAKSLWGVCYGLGFGAGLGLAFHLCQTKTRALLKASSGESGR